MRKGYGPTGVSFPYFFDDFKADLAKGKPLLVETVINGNTFTSEFSPDMSESEARVLFDKLDNLSLQGGRRTYQLFT